MIIMALFVWIGLALACIVGYFLGHALGYNSGYDSGYEKRLLEERDNHKSSSMRSTRGYV